MMNDAGKDIILQQKRHGEQEKAGQTAEPGAKKCQQVFYTIHIVYVVSQSVLYASESVLHSLYKTHVERHKVSLSHTFKLSEVSHTLPEVETSRRSCAMTDQRGWTVGKSLTAPLQGGPSALQASYWGDAHRLGRCRCAMRPCASWTEVSLGPW